MSETQMDKEIKDYLECYKVEFLNEEEMEVSFEYILQQVGPSESRVGTFKRRAKTLVLNSILELLNFSWLFWTLNGVFLVLGIISLVELATNPYLTAFFLAPLPFLIGVYEILKSKQEGLIELEMTFRYNAQQIFTSRLFVVGLYNLLINLLVSAVCIAVNPEVMFVKLLLSWTIPYVLVSGLAFLFAMQKRGTAASGILLAIWFAFCYGAFQIPDVREVLLKLDVWPAAGSLLVGVLLWTLHFLKFKRVEIWGRII
jgi:hypothetical protein